MKLVRVNDLVLCLEDETKPPKQSKHYFTIGGKQAADFLMECFNKNAAAPVQAQEPVAAAISYWKGPTNSNGTPRECGDANIGRWLDYEPTTLKHGMAIKDRGDPDKRVKFLFDATPVHPVAVPDDAVLKKTLIAIRDRCHGIGIRISDDVEKMAIAALAAPAAQGNTLEGELTKIVMSGAETDFPGFLDWIANRLVYRHGDNPNIDYVQTLRLRASQIRTAIAAKAAS